MALFSYIKRLVWIKSYGDPFLAFSSQLLAFNNLIIYVDNAKAVLLEARS
jgi:hypothetical protein